MGKGLGDCARDWKIIDALPQEIYANLFRVLRKASEEGVSIATTSTVAG
jgi:hypothetical protein